MKTPLLTILILASLAGIAQSKPAYQKCSAGKRADSIAFAKKIDYYVYLLEHNKSLKIKILLIALTGLSLSASAQTKKDSTNVSTKDLQTIQRNSLLIQQTIHRMDMSALLRDKLDSVYSQSAVIIDERLKVKKP